MQLKNVIVMFCWQSLCNQKRVLEDTCSVFSFRLFSSASSPLLNEVGPGFVQPVAPCVFHARERTFEMSGKM